MLIQVIESLILQYRTEYLKNGPGSAKLYSELIDELDKTIHLTWTNLCFGIAIEALKRGYKVRRTGWNGKGMWLTISPGKEKMHNSEFWNAHNRNFALENGGHADVLPAITMKTADNKILIGWLASQTDMLAEDWEILDEAAAMTEKTLTEM